MLVNSERLNLLLVQEKLEAVIATSPENVTYCSGFWALSQWIRRGPQNYVLWPAPHLGAPTIIASTSLMDLVADQQPWVTRVRRYGEFAIEQASGVELDDKDRHQAQLFSLPDDRDALGALANAIRESRLENARIGIEELGLAPGYLAALRERFPAATFCPADGLLRRCRAVKTPDEIVRLRRVAEIAEQSIASALEIAREGATELDFAIAFHERTVREGGFPVLACIGFGERSAMINVQPSDRRLRKGDVIRFDVGGRYGHYRADIARIAVFGEPSAKVNAYYGALHAGVMRGFDVIKPGVLVRSVFEAVVDTVRKEGIPHYRRTHVGHGIGIDGYDAPNLSPSSNDVIEEGMVLCVETPYYELGSWGLQVEDMVVVRADGIESLMQTDGRLVRL